MFAAVDCFERFGEGVLFSLRPRLCEGEAHFYVVEVTGSAGGI